MKRGFDMKRNKILVVSMITVFLLSACSPNNTTTESTVGTTSVESSTNAVTTTADAVTNDANEVSLEEQVVFDSDDIKISVKSITHKDGWGEDINFLLENSTNENIVVQVKNLSVNGYMIDGSMSTDVVSGKKSNDRLYLPADELKACNIDSVATIEFRFIIMNPNTYETNAKSDVIVLKTSIADNHKQEYDDAGDILYQDDNVKIVSRSFNKDGSLGPTATLYVENNSKKDFVLLAKDTSIDGFMVEPSCSINVVAGKKAIGDITFFQDELDENNISSITDIETTLHIIDENNYSTIKKTDVIKIKVN